MTRLLASLLLLLAVDERAEVARLAPQYGAATEVTQWDKSRVDMLTDTHAIEVDRASKWAEGVGQCLYYAIQTHRTPGLLLLADDDDDRYVYRAQAVCARHGITLYVERVDKQ